MTYAPGFSSGLPLGGLPNINPQDFAIANYAAQNQIPLPGAAGTPAPGLGQLMGSPLGGVQQPGAVPGMQYTGGISGAQGAGDPAGISGANSGIAGIMQHFLPAAPAPVQSLGAMMRGAGVVR